MVWMLPLHHSLRVMASRNHEGVADAAEVIVVRVAVRVVVSGVSEAVFAGIEAAAVAIEVASVADTGVDGLMVTGGATKIVDVAGHVHVRVKRGEAIMRGAEFLLLENDFCE